MYPENLASDSKWMLGKKNIVGWSWGGTKPLRFIPDSPLEASPTRLLSRYRQAAGELGVWPLLQENFHGLRSLVGYSPWCRKESDTTERLYFIYPLKIRKWNFMFPHHIIASLVVQWQRILLPMQDMWVRSLAREDPLEEEEMITRSSIPAWEIPWTEEPGGLQSMGSQSQAGLSTSHHSNKDSLTVLTLMQGDWWWPQGAPLWTFRASLGSPSCHPLINPDPDLPLAARREQEARLCQHSGLCSMALLTSLCSSSTRVRLGAFVTLGTVPPKCPLAAWVTE